MLVSNFAVSTYLQFISIPLLWENVHPLPEERREDEPEAIHDGEGRVALLLPGHSGLCSN